MRELRLIGVHDDGQRLVLRDGDGKQYAVALDEALRAAARRDRPALGQLQIAMEGGASPREVQSMIRAGLTADEAAHRSGWTVEKVRKFEGPILAEREYMAGKARECAVEPRGERPTTLTSRVERRLRDRGVDPAEATWDSSRDESGVWTVQLAFEAGGRERLARWRYEPLGGSVLPTNDEARWMSEPDSAGPIPAPHVLPGDDPLSMVYDIEADGGVRPREHRRGSDDPVDLMAAMRDQSRLARRTRRRGPATAPRGLVEVPEALPIDELLIDPATAPEPPVARAAHPVESHLNDEDFAEESDDIAATEEKAVPQERAGRRQGRPKVPTWDEIVFGTKGSGQS